MAHVCLAFIEGHSLIHYSAAPSTLLTSNHSPVWSISNLPTPRSPGAVKMMTLAPEVPGAIELTRELVDRGWIVSLGHTRADLEQLEQAFAAGARHLTHFMNAMPPLHHRTPGPSAGALLERTSRLTSLPTAFTLTRSC